MGEVRDDDYAGRGVRGGGEDAGHEGDDFGGVLEDGDNVGEEDGVVAAEHLFAFLEAFARGDLVGNGAWEGLVDVLDCRFSSVFQRADDKNAEHWGREHSTLQRFLRGHRVALDELGMAG